jgi:hypothetical protein
VLSALRNFELRGRIIAIYRTMFSMIGMGIGECYTLTSVHTVVIMITKIQKQFNDHNYRGFVIDWEIFTIYFGSKGPFSGNTYI